MIQATTQTTANYLQSTEKTSREEQVKEIKQSYDDLKQKQMTQILVQIQSFVSLSSTQSSGFNEVQEFKDFLVDIGYSGKPIASLSQEEAGALVSEDGFFGVSQTSQRIANFVIAGSGGDENLLREGRKGILQGFKEAEQMWGGKLPDIAYETITKAVEMIDKALVEGGFSIIDESI